MSVFPSTKQNLLYVYIVNVLNTLHIGFSYNKPILYSLMGEHMYLYNKDILFCVCHSGFSNKVCYDCNNQPFPDSCDIIKQCGYDEVGTRTKCLLLIVAEVIKMISINVQCRTKFLPYFSIAGQNTPTKCHSQKEYFPEMSIAGQIASHSM